MQPTELLALPVVDCAEKDAVLLMWAVWPKLPLALQVMSSWGFTFQTLAFLWVKTYADPQNPFMGMGFYTRANSEPVLLGTRGRGRRRKDASVSQLVEEFVEPEVLRYPVGRHSAKPGILRRRIEQLYDGPYLELFAREAGMGWDIWGNQAPTEPELEPPNFWDIFGD